MIYMLRVLLKIVSTSLPSSEKLLEIYVLMWSLIDQPLLYESTSISLCILCPFNPIHPNAHFDKNHVKAILLIVLLEQRVYKA